MWPIDRPAHWVGRRQELAALRAGAEALRQGGGAVVWVEGEAGIGKSSLVAEALADTVGLGWDISWGTADQFTDRLPLRLMVDCLRVRPGSPDARRARAAELLRDRRLGFFGGADLSVAGIEVLVTLVDELCAAAPTVLVIDDLHWADDASLLVWHQLATAIDQLRLLLIATCRPDPRRPELRQLRTAVERRGGAVIRLGPLPETDVAALVTAMLGSTSGDTLRQLTDQSAGNPLYLRELVDALGRERAQPSPAVEVAAARDQLPASLAAVLNDRLSSVSADTAQLLQTAALLGGTFTVTDLAALLRRPASGLAAGLQEALAAGLLAGSGTELAFRHPLLRQALYESMPAALRRALHAEAARQLASAGADALTVAQQLSAGGQPGAAWARNWLVQAAPVLIARAPRLAGDLLQRELDETPAGDEAWYGLVGALVLALLAAGSYAEAARRGSQALPFMTNPVRRAETYSLLSRAQISAGDNDEAIATLRQALASVELPRVWHARMLAMLPMFEHTNAAHPDAMEAIARRALAIAEEVGDAFATANALTQLWLTNSIRRDHAAALEHVDRALHVLGEDPGYADLRSRDVDARIFTLQNLDRWPDAELALRRERESAQRGGSPDRATWITAAVLRYWLGQWDDALAELNSGEDDDAPGLTHTFLREGDWPALLVHGVTALIAGRRDQRAVAGEALRLGLAVPVRTNSDRENQDFLAAAHAIALEQQGEIRQAMLVLAGILPRREGEMTLIHQWLPDLVRLAGAAGDERMAQAAMQACQAEAAAETPPARAAAASLLCRGLLWSDPGPLQDAVAHYRSAGPVVELPKALEDLAAVLAKRGRDGDARAALNEAVSLYEDIDARWDVRRADSRLRAYGVRRGVRPRRGPRPDTGWNALTPTELKIAALMARGDSTSDIARGMFLSRRTVQTYISRILAKLGVKSRVDIVREVLRHGLSPLPRQPSYPGNPGTPATHAVLFARQVVPPGGGQPGERARGHADGGGRPARGAERAAAHRRRDGDPQREHPHPGPRPRLAPRRRRVTAKTQLRQHLAAIPGGPQQGVRGGRRAERHRVAAVVPVGMRRRGDAPPRRSHVVVRQVRPRRQPEHPERIITHAAPRTPRRAPRSRPAAEAAPAAIARAPPRRAAAWWARPRPRA
jgi:DNA-binding CsgD family transcriptional regulator